MNIKNDYSYLFDSLNSSSLGSGSNLFGAIDLSEYYSIKSGTYGKLLKTYYAEANSSTTSKTSDVEEKKTALSEDTAVEKLTEVSSSATTLESSAEKLINRGTDSLFKEKELTVKGENGEETTTIGYDMDAIYDAVNDFTKKYNAFLKSVDNSDSTKLDQERDNLTSVVSSYAVQLEKAGITVNEEDNTLSVDKDVLKAADIADLKKLFNGNASFTYNVSTKASMIGVSANSEANTMKNYTSSGTYDQSLSTGNLLDSLI